jgi:CRP/FNR family transcriptional regulator, anaerobic regulatory protein
LGFLDPNQDFLFYHKSENHQNLNPFCIFPNISDSVCLINENFFTIGPFKKCMEVLIENMMKLASLSQDEAESFVSKGQVLQFKKKAPIVSMGSICKSIYYIHFGSVRYYSLEDNGNEKTGQFFFENAWFTNYHSFLTGAPSEVAYQAMEKTELFAFSKELVYQMYDANPRFERYGRLMAEHAFLGLKQKNNHQTHANPMGKYLQLISERPKVIQRIPLVYIASYLGVQPETLSRIRRKLTKK